MKMVMKNHRKVMESANLQKKKSSLFFYQSVNFTNFPQNVARFRPCHSYYRNKYNLLHIATQN